MGPYRAAPCPAEEQREAHFVWDPCCSWCLGVLKKVEKCPEQVRISCIEYFRPILLEVDNVHINLRLNAPFGHYGNVPSQIRKHHKSVSLGSTCLLYETSIMEGMGENTLDLVLMWPLRLRFSQ